MATAPAPLGEPIELAPVPVRRFSVDAYRRILDAGVLDEDDRVELLEGWIVPKMTRKPPHDVILGEVGDVLRRLIPPGWHVREQMAITTADSEPEPDLAVVRGARRDYLARHPGPGEIALVVEVADTSLSQDRGLKARIYARAGIPAYWIVNLLDGQVEVFEAPSGPGPSPGFGAQRVVRADGTIPLAVDGRPIGLVVARDVLP